MIVRAIFAAILLGPLAVPVAVNGRTSVGPLTSQEALVAAARDIAGERQMFQRRRTLQSHSMRDLVDRTVPISPSAILKYQGDWHRYWLARNMKNQRSGKTLEAAFAWRANVQRAQLGIPDRMLVIAVEGFPTHPVDLVDLAPNGRILRRYKLSGVRKMPSRPFTSRSTLA